MKHKNIRGFTIVELLIVIVVIGILAAITIVAFNGVRDKANNSVAQTTAKQAYTKILAYSAQNNDQYPATLAAAEVVANPDSATLQYSVDNAANPKTFCVTATSGAVSYYVSNASSTPTSGNCSGHIVPGGSITIQLVTAANCPASAPVRAVDARDNRTYWVQKLDDGKCWMLTNLAYAGGGTNTYSDVRTITEGTGGAATYTAARYYVIPTGANPTNEPTNPSTSTTGTGQYGYLYNWCAAMGVQSTSVCANATTPAPNVAVSICPAGWRLPTGTATTGEYPLLNNAVNNGSLVSDNAGTGGGLRTKWLSQRGGLWYNGYSVQGDYGYFWSSTQNTASTARYYYAGNSYIAPSVVEAKSAGLSVRCVAI